MLEEGQLDIVECAEQRIEAERRRHAGRGERDGIARVAEHIGTRERDALVDDGVGAGERVGEFVAHTHRAAIHPARRREVASNDVDCEHVVGRFGSGEERVEVAGERTVHSSARCADLVEDVFEVGSG